MRLLSRYVLFEVLKVFLVALAAMTAMMLIVGVVREATDRGLGGAQVARLIPYILPDMLRYTVPATLLFAVSSVYGRMAGSNEIVAVKSLGINPMVVVWPTFVFAFLLSLLTVWLNDVAVSWGRNGIQRVVIEAVDEIVYGMLRTKRSYATKQFSINVKAVDGRRLMLPKFWCQPSGGQPARTVMAEEAELRIDPEANVLTIEFRDATVNVAEYGFYAEFDHTEVELPLQSADMKGDRSFMPSQMPIRVIPKEIATALHDIKWFEQEMAAKSAYALLEGDYSYLVSDEWVALTYARQDKWNRLYRLRTEPHRRWSNGFSCLCFALVGVPMAILRRNSDYFTSFFLCFLPILLVYYPLLITAVNWAKDGDLPAASVWLGNCVLAASGFLMLRRVIRY